MLRTAEGRVRPHRRCAGTGPYRARWGPAMSAKTTLDALDEALFGDSDGGFWTPLDTGREEVSKDNLLTNKAFGHFGHLGHPNDGDMGSEQVAKHGGNE